MSPSRLARERPAAVTAALLLALATPGRARADHLEDARDWGRQYVTGGLAAYAPGAARMASADVAIRVDPTSLRVRVTYAFDVPSARVETWGVPLQGARAPCDFDSDHPEACRGDEHVIAPGVEAVPRSLKVTVAGRDVGPCRLSVKPPTRVDGDVALLPWEASPGGAGGVDGWCGFAVPFPAGQRVPVVLELTGRPTYADERSALGVTSFSPREVGWRVAPGGGDAAATVAVDVGKLDGLATLVRPGGATFTGARARVAGPAGALDVALRVDAAPVLRTAELVRWPYGGELRASASSARGPQGGNTYGPERAVDADATTAWCEGAPGDGVGEWIEVRLGPTRRRECEAIGWVVVPGYAKSEATWTGNARVRRLRLSRCDDPTSGVDVVLDGAASSALALADRPDRGAVLVATNEGATSWGRDPAGDAAVHLWPGPVVPMPAGPLPWEPLACLRLTLLEVVPGKHPDACISEVRPILGCRSE